VGRWQRYWFADGGRTALAIVRIAVATSVLLALARLDNPVSTGDLPGARTLYRAVGIWMLLGDHAPPDALVTTLWVVAWSSTVAMLLGAATRTSTAISFVSAVALAALSFAASRTWSHQYNVVFLAQMALLGGRAGDVVSIDWLVRRLRGLPAHDVPRGYQWSLRLVQLAVALMFAGAVFHKLLHSHFTLRWALSDNLRHHLLMRFDLAGLPRPPLVDWIIDDPLKYRTAAVLNMISQAAPLAAVFLVRRPWLRALAGSFFVVETIALGLVVELWNLHWLPLAAVFVDWDRVVARVTRRPLVHPEVPPSWRPRRAARLYIVAFVAYDLVTAFVPTLDQRLNTYPFSGFPMFAKLRARPPYDVHQPYGVAGVYFEVISDRPTDPPTQRWFDHQNRHIVSVRDPAELRRRMAAVLAQGQKRYWDFGVKGLRLWLAIYEAPAYPEPARFERHPIALMGELLPDGTFRTALGRLDGAPGASSERAAVTLQLADIAEPQTATLVYFRDELPRPIEIPVERDGARWDLAYQPIEGHPIHFVAILDGTPWLVATYAPFRW
jgi:hypothetical protein